MKPVHPLVGVYRTGERFGLGGNELLEIRAAFARAKKARQTFFPETIHGKIVMKGDAKTRPVLLVVGTVRPSCSQRRHPALLSLRPILSVAVMSFAHALAQKTDYLIRNAGIATAVPSLFVNCSVSLACDLPIAESIAAKFFWQWLVELPFLTTSLSRSARFRCGRLW